MPEHLRRQAISSLVLPQLQRMGEGQRREPQPHDTPFLSEGDGFHQGQQKEDSRRPGLDEQLSSQGIELADTESGSGMITTYPTAFPAGAYGTGY